MQGILENVPVALMAMLMEWPLVAIMLGLPVVLALATWRRGTLCSSGGSRWGWVLAGFIAGGLVGPVLAPGVMDGGIAALGYWLDWVFLAVVAAATGIYLALIVYLATRLQKPRPQH